MPFPQARPVRRETVPRKGIEAVVRAGVTSPKDSLSVGSASLASGTAFRMGEMRGFSWP